MNRFSLKSEGDPEKSRTGLSVQRSEDARFVRGRGRFVADITRPGECFAWFVRSIHASAHVQSIDASGARAAPGVLGVFTGADVAADGLGAIPWEVRPPPPAGVSRDDLPPLGDPSVSRPQPVMAAGRVRYVGEIVAMVVGRSENQARDAAELVMVEYAARSAVIDTLGAVAPGAPLVLDEVPDNVCFTVEGGDRARVDAAFSTAAHVVKIDVVNQRILANPVEPRAYIGEFDPATGTGGRYTLYATAGKPHPVRNTLADDIFHLPREDIRVVAPDIGGGFGAKNVLYPEQCLVLWAARKSGRPVKWLQPRIEAAQSDMQARDQVNHVELALDRGGRFLALRADSLACLGGYLAPRGVTAAAHHRNLLSGLYIIPEICFRTRAVHSNTVPTCPVRGAGAPEAVYLLERLIDVAAVELGLDGAEIRRRNYIAEAAMPFTTAQNATYDSGRFEANMDRVMQLADWDGFASRRDAAAGRGRLRGIGLANSIESHGMGISESAEIRIGPDGRVEVLIGTMSSGQGHATVYGQIAAEVLGIGFDRITVVQGDTDRISEGSGTGASRSLIVGGAALKAAAEAVVEKGRGVAARVMEAAEADIVFEDGAYRIAGTDRVAPLAEIARAEPGPEPDLRASRRFDPTATTWPNGCHVAEVEIDPDTGAVELIAYAMVQDSGRMVNPAIVKGQMHGGVAFGVGQALMERAVYDPDSGQMLSATWLDYCMPRADDLPSFVYEASEVPCLTNPLGVKAVGESGPVAAPPAVIGAICNALRDYGIRDVPMPATPETVWRLMRDAGGVSLS